jgi:hypothetical protein
MPEELRPLCEPAALPSAHYTAGLLRFKGHQPTGGYSDLNDDIRVFCGPQSNAASATAETPFPGTIPFSQWNLSNEFNSLIFQMWQNIFRC